MAVARRQLPHIFFVIVDDLGWANVGYHRTDPRPPIHTPHIDELVREGVELNRHYVHMMCTPSRASFQSGRLPVHVLTQLADPCDSNGAIPRNMTGIAAVLKKAGYSTHQVGKWDAGMATPHHTPKGRGYDTSLSYFGHGNWMWTEREWLGSTSFEHDIPSANATKAGSIVDLWDTDRPARHLNGTAFEEDIFRDRMLQILHDHNQSTPLFLQYDSRLVHYPLQAPVSYQQRFASVDFDHRKMYEAMIAFLDDQLANITSTMKALGMWDNTLMVLTSDNGGYVRSPEGTCNTSWPSGGKWLQDTDVGHGTTCFNGESGANNWPLRGGKYSGFEGGIRVTAFMSGGFLPAKVRGTRLDEMLHIADWYATLAEGIAGLDPTDEWARASGLPPVDSINMWPLLSGAVKTSPRATILVTKDILISGPWKYVRGNQSIIEAAWGGPQYPNRSTVYDSLDHYHFLCPRQGCLFNVVRDPHEREEVSLLHMDVVRELRRELNWQAESIWEVDHTDDPVCRDVAQSLYGGFYGPFKEVAWQREEQSAPTAVLPLPAIYVLAIIAASLAVVVLMNREGAWRLLKCCRGELVATQGNLGSGAARDLVAVQLPADVCKERGRV
eukprot:CAMPEP_0178383854 /NCGR_PEP_ID=MMETSP0689_2-20121128/7215_1 /TAXON_ID=160604 /ORGANISM="Amphidinium massartii, Strain CS-259" /LENGTH=611 /DNA_ID=CAMNT_0020004085 /DNA_START=85 /DNA_END=1920 /DNA_ORIENTATION=+